MADYWKSQDKKYCEFCRCWITDNKPSVEFHEKGRRHKENVAKKLRNIQKQSTRVQKETVKVDNAIKQMELAALEAYNKDIANNADLSYDYNNPGNSTKVASGKKLWQEYKGNDGRSYYQNVITNETVYVPPKEGYTSLSDQRKQSYNVGKRQMKAVQRHNLIQARVQANDDKHQDDEERARLFREKMKERRAEDLPEVHHAPIIPAGKSTPYGQWETVKESVVVPVDLQLPQPVPEYEIPYVEEEAPIEPKPIEFKEKVVENLEGDNVGFKKRKIGFTMKRNIRQRIDDD